MRIIALTTLLFVSNATIVLASELKDALDVRGVAVDVERGSAHELGLPVTRLRVTRLSAATPDGTMVQGLEIYIGDAESKRTATAYVDEAEMDALVVALQKMKAAAASIKQAKPFEIRFTTADGVRLSLIRDSGSPHIRVTIEDASVKLHRIDSVLDGLLAATAPMSQQE